MQPQALRFRFLLATLCCASLAGLSACGDKDTPKAASQVAAKVGSDEISVHQINQILSQTNTRNASPQEISLMGRAILERLIDQQIAVTQALEKKLNRTPEVVTQLEASRREILASAYLRQVTSNIPPPTDEEIRAYFNTHPQLFSRRRVFRVQEIVTAPTPGLAEQLAAFTKIDKPVEVASAWLKARNIPHTGGSATRSAEQIPLDILPAIHAMTDGQAIVLTSESTLTLLQLLASQSIPVSETVAFPRIAQFLSNQRITEAVTRDLQELRSSTKVVYVGEFSQPAATEQPPSLPEQRPSASTETPRTALDKGVAGLK
ncbi:peptidylprolyl isomerase [Hylemonella gracilis str. Niagara R]|uniref:peptidylprolyl isomerase n=1 Tax=Hylemonella gracilis str. Niagara R TaxID=1458275 RepID=A0A016XIN4_9BURK|nr:EpsD family peptidyl-prolyl cis-trans isomerase [Hylemonella gracilis]EYC51959.1 peptidylprolyl isomerase [Hylemonella gracilis str. Niagara R]